MTIFVSMALAFAAAAGFALFRAGELQRQITREAVTDAASASDDLDHEIEAMRLLLVSLTTSPALKAGDLHAFYDQLIEVPKPEGSWLSLWDNERELLTTRRPFGGPLHRLSAYPGAEAMRDRLRAGASGFLLGNRFHGLISDTDLVPLLVRIENPRGVMTGMLVAALSSQRFDSVMARQRLPAHWRVAIFDRNGAAVSGADALDPATRDYFVGRAIRKSERAAEGYFTARLGEAPRAAYAFSRSPASGFLTLIKLPLADVRAPITDTFSQIALAALLLGLTGAGVLAVLSREAVQPWQEITERARTSEADLRIANAHLRTVLAGISDCYMTLDREFRVAESNDANLAWLQLDAEEVIGRPLWELVPDAAEANEAARRCMAERRALHLELPSGVHKGRWLDFRMYPSAAGISIFFRDITERRRAIEEAEQTRKLLEASVAAISAPLLVLDDRLEVVFSNQAWKAWTATHAPHLREEEKGDFGSVTRGLVADGSRGDVISGVRMLLAKRGASLRWSFILNGRTYHLSAAGFQMEDRTRVVLVIEDITQITMAKDQIQKLSRTLLSLQEAERRRIAVELHDSTAQHLVAVGLGIMRLRQLNGTGEVQQVCDRMAGSVEEALREIRSFSYLLHPPKLESEGLEISLRTFLDGFSRRTGLATSLRWRGGTDPLPFETQRSLLRVVQEALMNVHRHADASNVWVGAREQAGSFRIRILDDGRGIHASVEEGAASEGVGIPGMKSRLQQMGGDLIIVSGRRGTVVLAAVPIVGASGLNPGVWSNGRKPGFHRERVGV
jgi:signal transduction histidine kinase